MNKIKITTFLLSYYFLSAYVSAQMVSAMELVEGLGCKQACFYNTWIANNLVANCPVPGSSNTCANSKVAYNDCRKEGIIAPSDLMLNEQGMLACTNGAPVSWWADPYSGQCNVLPDDCQSSNARKEIQIGTKPSTPESNSSRPEQDSSLLQPEASKPESARPAPAKPQPRR